MISDEMRRRIAALNRGSLRHAAEAEAEPEGGPGPEAQARVRVFASAGDARVSMSLEEAADGAEARNGAGCFYLIERPLQALLHGGGGAFGGRYARAVAGPQEDGRLFRMHPCFHGLADAGPEDVLFVDIEATGLSAGTPLFLVGALRYGDRGMEVAQLLARDYTEEAALLTHFSGLLEGARVVVSFNGKSYDLPYIRDRSIFLGVPFRLRQAHIDMLHEARRRWRRRLPNCRLQTLERYICRRMRSGDIPGAEIPEAYHRFVRTGNAVQMRDIIHHNALDLITLAELLVVVLEGREP